MKRNPQIRIVKQINARRSQFEIPKFQLLYKSYTNKREYKRGLLIITSPLGGITLTHTQHAEQHRVDSEGANSGSSKLERRMRQLLLPIVACVVVLRLRTCCQSISTICTGHWLPPYAFAKLCGRWNARGCIKRPNLRL